MQLSGRTMWLIGASSGIGAALAPELAAKGVRLAISARRGEELERVADTALLRGFRPVVKTVDVTQKDDIERVYGELVEQWGKVDILFYNAGAWGQADVDHFDTDQAINQIEVLYLGLVRSVGAVLPVMLARGAGEIVGMASIAGYAGLPTASAYSSAKAGVIAFLQSLRIELKRRGVGVTTISPGFVKTPLTDRNSFPMPFLMEPEAAAKAIVDGLASGQAEVHFPKRFSWPVKVYTALPRPLFEALTAAGMVRRR